MNLSKTNLDLLFEGRNASIYFQVSDQFPTPVIVKVLNKNHPTPEELAQFNNEYIIAQVVNEHGTQLNDTEGIRKIYQKGFVDQKPALYMEFIEGKTLGQRLKEKKPLKTATFLPIAISLAHILGRIHHHHIVHRDINPNNIMITPDNQVKVIDLGLASQLPHKTFFVGNHPLEGTIAYISPEQTGRMNRRVDYRSDLYSLGVTFYEMLTGRLPFQSTDKMEVVHAHLAVPPIPPEEINPSIPPILSKIVLKLLAKNAEDRYQSAYGLKVDLSDVDYHFKAAPHSPIQVNIGQKDHSGMLRLSENLYGRKEVLQQLTQVYEKVAQGSTELALIAGKPGVGKSSLIHEMYPKIAQSNGFFIEGKYAQFQQQIPYSAITQAFNGLFRYLTTLPESQLAKWRTIILEVIGSNGRLLTDVMPDLELIIGPQPPVNELSGQEGQNRFQRLVQNFVKAISRKENPLVLFLDDLQWADASSLQLLRTMLNQDDNHFFWVIGAYRNNELSASHPLNDAIQFLKQNKITPVHEILLDNLTIEDIRALLSDTLHFDDPQKLYQFTELVHIKTQGNAFFVSQFLTSLYEEMLLTYSFKKQSWEWDIQRIQQRKITDNVAELMTDKVSNLPEDVQKTLKIAACFGNKFNLNEVAHIQKTTPENVFKSLWVAISAGYVNSPGNHLSASALDQSDLQIEQAQFTFAHARIEQAIYGLLSLPEQEQLHQKIGQLLYEKQGASDDFIFAIVNHFNRFITSSDDSSLQLLVAQLNHKAGQKAQKANAYEAAINYYAIATTCLNNKNWEEHYPLMFDVYFQCTACALLTGEFELAQNLYNQLLQQDLELLDRVETYQALSDLSLAQSKVEQSLEQAFEALGLLGIELPTQEETYADFQIIEYALANQHYADVTTEDIMNNRFIDSRKELLELKLWLKVGLTSYILGKVSVSSWAVMKGVNITLTKGSSPQAASFLLSYGMSKVYEGDHLGAYKIGKLALNLSEKVNSKTDNAMVNYLFGANILHWVSHQRKNARYQRKAIEDGLEGGNHAAAAYGMFSLLLGLFLTGHHLEEVEAEYNTFLPTLKRIDQFIYKDNVIPGIFKPLQQLQGKTPYTTSFDSEDFNEVQFVDECQNNGLALFYTAQARNLYIFNHFEQGAQLAEHYSLILQSFPSLISATEGVFYIALHLLAVYDNREKAQQAQDLVLIDEVIQKMEKWALDAPTNFRARHLFLLAEKAHLVEQKQFDAIDLYEMAIEEAHRTEYLYLEAMVHERLANFWLQHKKESYARLHLKQAAQLYKGWGAKAKVKMMQEQFPYFLSGDRHNLKNTEAERTAGEIQFYSTTHRSSTGGGVLDFNTILKSTNTLIGEVRLEPLLEKMLRIVAENAGAQRIFIIENVQDDLIVRLKGELEGKEMGINELGIPLDKSTQLPVSLINYVFRNKTSEVIPNAVEEKLLRKDAYVRKNRPKSVLCYPIIRQERVSIIFYMENNLAIGAFTSERLEILNILSSQITVSIENALLYENLEEKVKERTEELRSKNKEMSAQAEIMRDMYQQLQKRNKDVTSSINYARRIQTAALPLLKHIKQQLPELFLIYRPRDIVSGDFYWYGEKEGKVIISAIDCTGHGVPGAFMSMIANTLLKQIVYNKKITDPGQILESLHIQVLTALRQRQSENSDGMDMTICVIDKKQRKLQFAGAKNPMYFIQKQELQEVKGNIMPIGGVWKRVERREFTTHTFALDTTTTVYIHSDGYQDQLGGPAKFPKKFMKKKFRTKLFDNHEKPMAEQQQIMEDALDEWMGELHHQTDDILLIGFRITPEMLG
ncbi:hypothetical protein BKI52_35010 [marine bacterium AO1-C]|nr:hypothetical protein BKI52_35010 [marine bacterium AO1-C]